MKQLAWFCLCRGLLFAVPGEILNKILGAAVDDVAAFPEARWSAMRVCCALAGWSGGESLRL